jgi:hypothetical protein
VNLFLATAAAGAFMLVSACGGGNVDIPVASSSGSGSSAAANAICQPSQAAIVGGNLFVAERGPIGVTLMSDGGMGPLIFDSVSTFGRGFMILYDNVFGMQVTNSQDWFGFAKPFAAGTQVGASTQAQLEPPPADVIRNYGPVPTTFPKGAPLQLWLKMADGNAPSPANSSGTADIGKDIWPYSYPTASVTYGANNSATVTFFAATDGPHFSVALTNVYGTGCR